MPWDDSLQSFAEIDEQWSGLLIGNGASRVVASRFGYKSLYDKACSEEIETPISSHEQNIFNALGTHNFEQVLSALKTGKLVSQAFSSEIPGLDDSYEHIRMSLVQAVHAVHLDHASVPLDTLDRICSALLDYSYIYSTNYDLLIYWAIMRNPGGFRDYFFSGSVFDLGNTEVWQKSTKILFLHGGLHLYKDLEGRTLKRAAGLTGNLLDDFATPIAGRDGALPLFVSEGTFQEKLRSIYTSDYLAFAYAQLSRHSGPLAIFGQSLEGEYDKHLIDAVRSSPTKTLGIGIHKSSGDPAIAKLKAGWEEKFSKLNLLFFDSSTHPLGSPELHVE